MTDPNGFGRFESVIGFRVICINAPVDFRIDWQIKMIKHAVRHHEYFRSIIEKVMNWELTIDENFRAARRAGIGGFKFN